jgi:hypothetical protein
LCLSYDRRGIELSQKDVEENIGEMAPEENPAQEEPGEIPGFEFPNAVVSVPLSKRGARATVAGSERQSLLK